MIGVIKGETSSLDYRSCNLLKDDLHVFERDRDGGRAR